MEESKQIDLFNSPLEVALRLVFILNTTSRPLDVDRLVYYNYLLVHSSDMPNSPKSIHADLPQRSNEIPVAQVLIKKALTLLISKGLVSIKYAKSGIQYIRNDSTPLFVGFFESEYAKLLTERTNWLCTHFDEKNDEEISGIIKRHRVKWGSELGMTISWKSKHE